MTHRRFYWLEKLQVQLSTAAAMLAVYFLVWPLLRPADPEMPLTFLVGDHVAALGTFALLAVVLAVVVGLLTVTARPEGALMAVVLGLAAAALRSGDFSALLRLEQDRTSSLFVTMILETLLLAAIVLAAAVIVALVRRSVAKLWPRAAFHSPLEGVLPNADLARPQFLTIALTAGGGIEGYLVASKVSKTPPKADAKAVKAAAPAALLTRGAYCFGLALAVAGILLMLLLRSDSRGQVIFAIIVAFAAAMLIAHQLFPGPFVLAAFLLPLVAAVVFYVLGSTANVGSGPQDWTAVPVYCRALPVDWMTFGTGGAMLGYWVSSRIYDMRHLEAAQKDDNE